jgi:hypothetical protein
MAKKYKNLIISIGMIAALALPVLVSAANPALQRLDNVAVTAGPYEPVNDTSLTEIIGTLIGIAIGLIGVIFLLLMIYAGYNWMTAQGEEEKVTRAKDTIIRSLIGLIIVIGAYAVWQFVFSRLF